MSAPRSLDSIYKKRRLTPKPAPVMEQKRIPEPKIVKKRRTPFGKRVLHATVWTLVMTAVYLVAAPYTPSLWFYFHPPQPIVATTVLHDVPAVSTNATPSYAYYGQNMLTISKIGVQSQILEGVDEATLDKGLWRRPHSSTPALGSNTVIAAHRYKYTTGPNTFYNLDKLAEGDIISLMWQGKQYTYEVYSTVTVSSSEISIEGPTDQPILTLYTCTPLWSSTNRLVVRARLLY